MVNLRFSAMVAPFGSAGPMVPLDLLGRNRTQNNQKSSEQESVRDSGNITTVHRNIAGEATPGTPSPPLVLRLRRGRRLVGRSTPAEWGFLQHPGGVMFGLGGVKDDPKKEGSFGGEAV